MMPIRRQKRKNAGSGVSNRLNVIMAIIFLSGGAILFRLYSLQVRQYDLYIALASDQHQAYNEISPERGKIFIRDARDLSGRELYPLATNKEFALVYAVPNDVVDAEKTAEKLYEVFDQKGVTEGVEEMLVADEYFAVPEGAKPDPKKEEFRKIKKELEIESRRKSIVEGYAGKLAKKGDPYEPIRRKVAEDELEAVKALGLAGVDYIMEKHRYYPEGPLGAHFLGFVGYGEDRPRGQYGLESFFDEELSGRFGSVSLERSASGDLIIINDREYTKPVNGSDFILTINRSIQFTACKKLGEAAEKHAADGGSVIVIEPKTGAILAMCSWPDYDPNSYGEIEDINTYNNPAIFDEFEPGSVFKVITMAAGIDSGAVKPNSAYEDKGAVKVEGWPKPIKNSDYDTHGAHGTVDMVEVLASSLNTGAIFVVQKTGAAAFAQYVQKFGFGEKTGIELETEGVGDIRNLLRENVRPVEAATASFGQGITATPLQLAAAYAAIANGGILMKPFLVQEIVAPGGERRITQPRQVRKVISERAALLLAGMMVNVVENGHAKKAAVSGYYLGGKTGTAQVADKENGGYLPDETIHTFIGFAPADDPKFVILVKMDHPKDAKFAESSVVPLSGEIAEFILDYYQVPKER